MFFNPEKSNLKDIHAFMTKVETLRLDAKAMEKKKNAAEPLKPGLSRRAQDSLMSIELELIGIKADIEGYKEQVLKSRQFLKDFTELKRNGLKK